MLGTSKKLPSSVELSVTADKTVMTLALDTSNTTNKLESEIRTTEHLETQTPRIDEQRLSTTSKPRANELEEP
jgi:hypothetical protein